MTQAQTDREQLIDSLVGAEWAFFQNVNNVGGRASCQDMPQTFSVMRRSQFAIWPDEGVVYAPVAGTVSASMPHAVGIAGDDGVEVLIHIGVDTVEMNGDGFTVWCEGNTHVVAGEPLVSFDRDKVKKAGHPDIIMTIITNSDDYPALAKVAEGQVKAGDTVITTA